MFTAHRMDLDGHICFQIMPVCWSRVIKVNAIKSDGMLNFNKTYGGFREITESADTVEMVVDLK